MCHFRLAGHVVWQKLSHWTSHANYSTKLVHTCHTYRHHYLLPFYTTFTDLDLTCWSQDQCKAKPIGFIFSHTVHLIWLPSTILYHFHWPWPHLLVTRSVQSKTNWLHFLTHCSSDLITFYHFIPLSLTLTSPAGHKISAKQNLLASFSHTLFIWLGWNLMWWWSNVSWTSCELQLSKICWNKGNNCCFTDCVSKKLNIGMLYWFDSNLVWW